MKKYYRGATPPIFAVLIAVVIALVTTFTLVCGSIQEARAATIPGSEIAPPGGTFTPPPVTTPAPPMVTPLPTAEPTVSPTAAPTVPPTAEPGAETSMEPSAEPSPESTPDIVGKYPTRFDTAGIKLVSPSIDELLQNGADLEKLLYPSGLKLPTKYIDLLVCAPVNSNTELTGEVTYFLKTVAPVEDNIYTYAEYKAAEIYLAICRLYSSDEGVSDVNTAVQTLDKNTTVNWMTNVTNATLSNGNRLAELISTYRGILEQSAEGAKINQHAQYRDLIGDHRGVRYSCGDLSTYTSLADGMSQRGGVDMSQHIMGLYSWWDYLGVSHQLTAAVLTYSKYYNEFAYNNINFNRGAPVTAYQPDPEESSEPEVSGPIEEQGPNVVGPGGSTGGPGGNSNQGGIITGGSTGGWTEARPGGNGDSPVTSVGGSTGTDTSILPTGGRNLKEVASIAAVIFVIVAVIALWAIHSYRKSQDPTRKFW